MPYSIYNRGFAICTYCQLYLILVAIITRNEHSTEKQAPYIPNNGIKTKLQITEVTAAPTLDLKKYELFLTALKLVPTKAPMFDNMTPKASNGINFQAS